MRVGVARTAEHRPACVSAGIVLLIAGMALSMVAAGASATEPTARSSTRAANPAPRDDGARQRPVRDVAPANPNGDDAGDATRSRRTKSRAQQLDAVAHASSSRESPNSAAGRDGRTEPDSASLACLAQALYWEAGTEGRHGMVAVAWVVFNRTRSPEFPDTVCGAVKQGRDKPGCQFSYWCDGKSDEPKQDDNWALAQSVAREMLTDPPPDPTGGALFYHSVDIRAPWDGERTRTARIGRHVYYR